MTGACTLTFDDGPDRVWTPRVLAELARCGVAASFFMIGERLGDSAELARAVVAAGHDVELHCDRHVRHTELAEGELVEDTRAGLRAFERAGLPRPRRWRAPWGITTRATHRVAAENSLELVHWTLDTHDWRGDRSEEMLEALTPGVEDGAIILMHDALGPGARRSGAGETVALIAPLHALLQERGLQAVPLSRARRSERVRAPRRSAARA